MYLFFLYFHYSEVTGRKEYYLPNLMKLCNFGNANDKNKKPSVTHFHTINMYFEVKTLRYSIWIR